MLTVGSPRISWAHVRASRWLSRAGMIAFAASELLQLGTLSAALLLLSLGAFVASYVLWFARGVVPGAIEIDHYNVRIRHGGTPDVWVRDRIQSAYYVSRYVRGSERILSGGRRAPTIEVVLKGGDLVSMEMPSADDAVAVLKRLGFGAGQRRVKMSLGAPIRRLYSLLMGLGAYTLGFFVSDGIYGSTAHDTLRSALTLVVVTFASYFGMKRLAREPEVTVGSDGVLVRNGARTRILRANEIREVAQSSIASSIWIQTADGHHEEIEGRSLDVERRAAAASLIQDRFIADAPLSAPEMTTEAFARNERSLDDWRKELAVRIKGGSYRAAAVQEDAASVVLVDGLASHEQRAGAALALRIAGEPPERIRVAARGVADEDLREALEAIAEEESDEVVDRALGRLARRR